MNSIWRLRDDLGFALGISSVLVAADVTSVEVLRFTRPRSFLGREVSESARVLARSAREDCNTRGYGFWDRMLWGAARSDAETRLGIFSRATAHGTAEVVRERMSVEAFGEAMQNGAFTDLPGRQIVSLCSRVELHESPPGMHLPMIDFALGSGPHNDAVIVDVVESLGLYGSIVDSGRSYHFYGGRVIRESELPRFLANAQLLGPLVDHRWASHQILEGECSLRISTDRERHEVPQRLVASSL
jgi:hypothetical protein